MDIKLPAYFVQHLEQRELDEVGGECGLEVTIALLCVHIRDGLRQSHTLH
jgi:hypothetical protein